VGGWMACLVACRWMVVERPEAADVLSHESINPPIHAPASPGFNAGDYAPDIGLVMLDDAYFHEAANLGAHGWMELDIAVLNHLPYIGGPSTHHAHFKTPALSSPSLHPSPQPHPNPNPNPTPTPTSDSFDTERSISLVPPDGEFALVNYRTTHGLRPPFRCKRAASAFGLGWLGVGWVGRGVAGCVCVVVAVVTTAMHFDTPY